MSPAPTEPSRELARALLALAALQLTRCTPVQAIAYTVGAVAGVAQAARSPSAPPPLPRAEALLSLTDLAVRDAATLRGERLDDSAVAAVARLPALRACLAAPGGARRVHVRWVVQGAAVTHVRVRVSPDDPALTTCVARAVSARGILPSSAHRRVFFAALPDAPPPAPLPPAGATPPEDAATREAQAHACASLRAPTGSSTAHLTIRVMTARTGEVVHAWHDPIDAPWTATARCVVNAALSWHLEARPGEPFREVELPFELAGEPRPEPAAAPTMAPVAVERFTLSNGLLVTVAPVAGAASVAVHMTYGVGSRDDPDGHVTLAHVAGHVAADARRAGGDGVGPALDAADVSHELVDYLADETRFMSVGPGEALERMLWAERERMAFTVGGVTEAIVDRATGAVHREVEADTMSRMRADVLLALYPERHPMRLAARREGAFDGAGVNAVRWFLQRWYRPRNAHLVVAGAVDATRARELVSRYFTEVRVSGPEGRRDALPPRRPQDSSRRLHLSAQYASLHVMWAAPPRCSRDELEALFAARLLRRRISAALTGSNPALEVASAFTDDLNRIDVWVGPGRSTDVALRVVDRVLEEAIAGGFRDDEIAALRSSMMRAAARDREDPEVLARALARCPSGDDPGGFAVAALLPQLDTRALHRALQTWLSPHRRIVAQVDEAAGGSR